MRRTTYRGLEKVSMQAMLTFAAMNLKKLATWLWRSGGLNGRDLFFLSKWLLQRSFVRFVPLKRGDLSTI